MCDQKSIIRDLVLLSLKAGCLNRQNSIYEDFRSREARLIKIFAMDIPDELIHNLAMLILTNWMDDNHASKVSDIYVQYSKIVTMIIQQKQVCASQPFTLASD